MRPGRVVGVDDDDLGDRGRGTFVVDRLDVQQRHRELRRHRGRLDGLHLEPGQRRQVGEGGHGYHGQLAVDDRRDGRRGMARRGQQAGAHGGAGAGDLDPVAGGQRVDARPAGRGRRHRGRRGCCVCGRRGVRRERRDGGHGKGYRGHRTDDPTASTHRRRSSFWKAP